jgi:hypothetical protein
MALVAITAACDSPTRPGRPPIALTIPSTVTGRYVSCATCEVTLWISVEFPVVVADPDGAGGTVQDVRVTATNQSRGTVLAGNTRPNSEFPYPNTTVPAGGTLSLMAGVVISPASPPRDEVVIAVLVTLSDGRTGLASAPLVVASE